VIVPWTMPFFLDHICSLDKLADEERAEKIEILRKAVAERTYNVSPDEVAGRLINHMREQHY
jgi:anti-sigma28 factor (negative regulator of flagellin synthesis)